MSLVAHYKLNSNALDSSGNGHNGSWSGTEDYAAGKIGQAADFDGASYIDCNGRFAPTGAFTYVFWIYRTTSSPRPFAQRGSAAGDFYWYLSSSGGFYFWRKTGGGDNAVRWSGSLDVPMSAWSHVALVYDGDNTLKFFVNGESEALTGSLSSSSHPTENFALGCGSPTQFFAGMLDDFRVYDEALPDWKINAIYNGGQGGESNLFGPHRCDASQAACTGALIGQGNHTGADAGEVG